jgi:glutathione S-transferase
MANLKPFDLYYLGTSANPWKVAMILEELGLPYNLKKVLFQDVKKEPIISLNPNGRLPILVDPNNNGITLWEVSY